MHICAIIHFSVRDRMWFAFKPVEPISATAARMIKFFADKQFHLNKALKNGIKRVRVHSTGGCPACNELDGKVFAIEDSPTYPLENCTSKRGCGCYYEDIWDDLIEDKQAKPSVLKRIFGRNN